MKGLKEFLEALKGNESLLAEVEKAQDDAKKVVEIAKKNGYSFTEDEYMDAKMDAVSGGEGSFFDDVKKLGGHLMNAYNVLNGQNPTGTTQGQGAGGQGVAVNFANDGYHYSRNGDYAIGRDGTVCHKVNGVWNVVG